MKEKVLIFGGSGLVGSRLIKLHGQKFDIKSPDMDQVNILKEDQVLEILKDFAPDVVINFAAFTDVQGAEEQKGDKDGLCYKLNVVGAKNVAKACQSYKTHLIHISTDYVFDGVKAVAPYVEEDTPNPHNWYGQTKYEGEEEVIESGCSSIIVRISMPFSSHFDLKQDIARIFLSQLRDGKEIFAITDQKITPVLVDDVANALYALIQKGSEGIYHVVSTTWTTPFDFATLIAKSFNLDQALIKSTTLDEYNREKQVRILRYSWLDPAKFIGEFGDDILHSTEESIEIFKNQQLDRFNRS
ncbi:MAG: NAD(P)-dependent oxidoreductase [Candidatus Daviesbacteria bacterium]|nr:NAD(P)-dependent oxidoreductase [Candidatus Daviesbacteria bacterium]